jgi:hypothetical protein
LELFCLFPAKIVKTLPKYIRFMWRRQTIKPF